MHNIKEIFNLKDNDIIIEDVKTDDETMTKYITVSKLSKPVFCPICNQRMYSKGIYLRKINHPILQDGYKLFISLRQRRYRCTNIDCRHEENEDYHFVDKYKRSTFMTPYLIINEFKDINVSCVQVARRYNVSDTYVHETFLRYVDLKRLKLPRILSIDEVYLDIDEQHRYCVVLMDFESGDIIDIIKNRYKDTLDAYFRAIPKEERDGVLYLISDMYQGYLDMARRYLKNCRCLVDSFHVIAHINNKINLYINEVKKKYQRRDRERQKELDYRENRDTKRRKDSTEVAMLKRYRWVLLKNQDDIEHYKYRRIRFFGAYIGTYEIEKRFLQLDENFPIIRELKELYIAFNRDSIGESEEVIERNLRELIHKYEVSEYQMFKDFAKMLANYKDEIVASFYVLPKKNANTQKEELYRRLSNGPMEGFNRKPKDMKRQARGYKNFDFIKNRILFATRKKAPILAIPKDKEDVATHTGKKRGSYQKKK